MLDARGSVELNCLPLSRGFLHIDCNGYVSFGGALDYDFVAFSLKAEVTAQYMDPHFQVDGNARGCLGDLGCIGGELVISDKGMGFCGTSASPMQAPGSSTRRSRPWPTRRPRSRASWATRR